MIEKGLTFNIGYTYLYNQMVYDINSLVLKLFFIGCSKCFQFSWLYFTLIQKNCFIPFKSGCLQENHLFHFISNIKHYWLMNSLNSRNSIVTFPIIVWSSSSRKNSPINFQLSASGNIGGIKNFKSSSQSLR